MKLKLSILSTLGVAAIAVSTAHANLLVSSGTGARLYSDSGSVLLTYSNTAANYQGNTTDGTNAYFADFNFGIQKYNLATGAPAVPANVTDNTFYTNGWPLYGIASKSSSDLIASYTLGANHHFVHLNPAATNTQTGISTNVGPPYEGSAYSPVGNLLYAVTPAGGGLIQKFDGTTGVFTGVQATGLVAPKDVAVNAAGSLIYIADNNLGQIRLWDGVSAATTLFATLSGAYGVDVDASGNVWASSSSTGVLNQYNSAGSLLSTANVGAGSTYITFTPVPEPSTYAFYALVGLSGLGLMVRRKWLRSA